TLSVALPPKRLPCRVEVVPADAAPEWLRAASALQRSLAARDVDEVDCGSVVVRAGGPAPSVEVTTLDGRRGVRELADPGDLEPTVEALTTTVSPATTAAPAAAVADSLSQTGGARPWQLLLVAAGGAQHTLSRTSAPLFEATVGTVRSRSLEL